MTIQFGQGGSAHLRFLSDDVVAALRATSGISSFAGDSAHVGIPTTGFGWASSGDITRGTHFSGAVWAKVTNSGQIVLKSTGPWNSVKNLEVLESGPATLRIDGFVHTDVVTGDGGDSTVLINGAKRGNVVTGDGDDKVVIGIASNNAGWQNHFNIATGDGNDLIRLKAANTSNTDVYSGAHTPTITDGSVTTSLIYSGAGDDTVIGHGSADEIHGGGGNDLL